MAIVVLVAALTWTIVPARAQETTAEVRMWNGQAVRLSQPTLEVFYTILPVQLPEAGSGLPPGPGSMMGLARAFTSPRYSGSYFGSLQAEAASLDRGGDPTQGRRQRDSITLTRDGVETQVPVASIATLVFSRTPVTENRLPPYVAVSHFRYAARAVLLDGSTVEGDSVNLGTTILRGATPQGRVDIPWNTIESIRFSR